MKNVHQTIVFHLHVRRKWLSVSLNKPRILHTPHTIYTPTTVSAPAKTQGYRLRCVWSTRCLPRNATHKVHRLYLRLKFAVCSKHRRSTYALVSLLLTFRFLFELRQTFGIRKVVNRYRQKYVEQNIFVGGRRRQGNEV